MSRQTNKFTTISLVVFVAAVATIVANKQQVIDYARLRNYTAPAEIATIASQDGLTPYAKKVFYVNHPQIDQKTPFKSNCPDATREQTIVLGCYHGGQGGIFLLNVTEPRLTGVKQVTAAHEMLHAAYDRLSTSDRQRVDAMLTDYYKNKLTDKRLLSTIDAYKKTEPDDVVNEMHSIFGTEIASLPAPLEQYYQKYFTDRSKVAGFSEQYQSEFTSRQNAVTAADAKLATLKQQIDAARAKLDLGQADITAKQQQLVALRNSNNIAAYNAGVGPYNQLVNDYNVQVQQVKNLIVQYNQLVATRNATAVEEDQLVKSLSADVDTINN
jgi:hypothetical protein